MLIRSVACVGVGVGFVAMFCNRTGGKQVEAMQAFDTKRRKQSEIEAGIVKFNQKPKDGLAYLVREPTQPLGIGGLLLAALVPVLRLCLFLCVCSSPRGAHLAHAIFFVAFVIFWPGWSSFCVLRDWPGAPVTTAPYPTPPEEKMTPSFPYPLLATNTPNRGRSVLYALFWFSLRPRSFRISL